MTINESFIKWEPEIFSTYTKLKKYLDKIKPTLVGKPIKSIFVPLDEENIYKTTIANNNILEPIKYAQIEWLIGPAIIKIGNHNFLIETFSGSYFEIALDKKIELINEDIRYHECSFIFSENIIGHKITDIYPTKAKSIDDFGLDYIASDYESEDMFKNLVIKLDNNYKLLITVIHDFTMILESKKR